MFVYLAFLSLFPVLAVSMNEVLLNIPPRLQWNENQGYCGEVSLISAGLSLGQYLSQYDSRAAACKTTAQNRCQMLLGENDETAAGLMHFNSEEFKTVAERDTNDFLVWVKQNVVAQKYVIIGVYTNECTFYNDCTATAGDADYDHIVPVVGIQSNHPLTDTSTYYADDVLIFSDNGLYGTPPKVPYPYLFNYTFSAFQNTRKQANDKKANLYSLPNTASNYGLAISGIKDAKKETIPVRVDTSVNFESPEIGRNSDTRPASTAVTLTITITNTATDSTSFVLYKYTSLSAVPDSDFAAHASSAASKQTLQIAKGASYVLTEVIQSSEVAVYRCVKA
jgi:hypothetical protein